jgi:glycosyltransferase involved in cell wall biosynthesis
MRVFPDISAILNFHREGSMSMASIESVRRSEDLARKVGIQTEVVLVLDRPNLKTVEIAKAKKCDHWKVEIVEFGDLGKSRNHGVSKSTGQLIAFLDADDIWAPNWLSSCVSAHKKSAAAHVFHPEVNLYFGEVTHIYHHIDMESEEFDLLDLALSNIWTALACTTRSILLDTPYPESDFENGLGLEDWSWNLQTMQKGLLHKTIPGTAHAIRVKHQSESLLQKSTRQDVSPHPSLAFQSLLKSS